jgi:hypothetical protein
MEARGGSFPSKFVVVGDGSSIDMGCEDGVGAGDELECESGIDTEEFPRCFRVSGGSLSC